MQEETPGGCHGNHGVMIRLPGASLNSCGLREDEDRLQPWKQKTSLSSDRCDKRRAAEIQTNLLKSNKL